VTKKQCEIANIFLSYKSGMVAHITSSWLSPVKIRTTYIAGSKKMIVYNDIEPSEKIRIFDKGVDVKNLKITPFTPLYRSGDILVPQIKQEEALRNELAHFLWCIRTNSTPITDGSCGLRVVQTLEAIDKAIKDGKKITLS
jgi:predicted dehydrogenase